MELDCATLALTHIQTQVYVIEPYAQCVLRSHIGELLRSRELGEDFAKFFIGPTKRNNDSRVNNIVTTRITVQ